MTLLNMIITQKSKETPSFRIKKNSSLGFNTDKDYRILVRIIFLLSSKQYNTVLE
jgi:hypothetical protein